MEQIFSFSYKDSSHSRSNGCRGPGRRHVSTLPFKGLDFNLLRFQPKHAGAAEDTALSRCGFGGAGSMGGVEVAVSVAAATSA